MGTKKGWRVLVGTASIAVVVCAAVDAQDPAAFERGLSKAHKLMERGEWKDARRLILQQLEEHREQDYVRAKRQAIVEDLKRCSFNVAHPAPKPDKLIGGELVKWDSKRGTIKLRYRGRDRLADFQRGETFHAHPLRLTDSYTITFVGKRYPSEGIQALIGLDGERSGYGISFGMRNTGGPVQHWIPLSIRDLAPAKPVSLEEKEQTPVARGKPFKLKIKVSRSQITLYSGSRLLLKAKIKRPADGQFAMDTSSTIEEVHIEGGAEPSWLQGLADAAQQEKLARFERSYRPKDDLPDWLATADRPSRDERREAAKRERRIYPGRVSGYDMPWLNAGMKLHNEGKLRELLDYVGNGTDDDAPEAARRYLLASACVRLERWDEAFEHADFVRTAHPEFGRGHVLAAAALFALRRGDEALAAIEAATAGDELQPADVYLESGLLLLDQDRAGDAKRVLARVPAGARRRFVEDDLGRLEKMLLMAEKGPRFTRRFEHESKHYVVVSDIDKKVCVEAAKVLEEAFVAYQAQLDWVKDERPAKFPVYLFAGEAGYQAYVRDIVGEMIPHTAGLYTGRLKQLLIWNLPNREVMMRTVRHEGFHQYLDRLVDDAPRWFNEGLAEYYETGRRERGRFRGGQQRPLHVALLKQRRRDIRPLDEFLFLDAEEFYADAGLHYAQAWALIHFLRESTATNRKLFTSFFDALRERSGSADSAVRSVLQGVDVDALDRDFRDYVASLK